MRAVPPGRAADLLVGLAMVLPTLGAWIYFVVLAGSELARPAYLASKLLQFTLPVLAWAVARAPLPRLRTTVRGTLGGLASGLVLAGGLAAVYSRLVAGSDLAAGAAERVRATLENFHVATPGGYLALAVFLAVGHSFAEEVYWRAFVFQHLAARLSPGPAVVLASAAFAAHHLIVLARYTPAGHLWTLALPATVAVALGGAHWCALYRRNGSVLPPWLSHLLVDATLLGLGWDLVATPESP